MTNKKDVWPSFQNFISTLISFFLSSPVPQIPQLFVSPLAPSFQWYQVESWARIMQSCNDAAQCFVERVVHCKCEDDKRHEFLRFEISSPTGSHTAIVFADRRVEVSQGIRQMETVLSPSSAPSTSENLLAIDTVWVATKGYRSETTLNNCFRNHLELRTLTFPHRASRPSAQYLAVLLQTTSVGEIYYDLDAHQSDWFAHTVFESLQMLHPSSLLSNGRDHKKYSQHRRSNIPKADSLDTFCSEFLKVWKKFLERKEEDQNVQRDREELLLERTPKVIRTEKIVQLERELETQRLEIAQLERKLETQRLEYEAKCQQGLERRLETEREFERQLETKRLEHEAERQQLLAKIKAIELDRR